MAEFKRWIEVRFQKEGVHKYPRALEDPKLADVKFLGYPHRHIFHFYVRISVEHNDREIEFIQFKRNLENLYSKSPAGSSVLELDYQSCEMIAEDLVAYLQQNYPDRKYSVRVYEDDENGACVEYI